MEVLIVYVSTNEDGKIKISNYRTYFGDYPPTIEEIRQIENDIETKNHEPNVSVVNYLPLA